jgi:hypothetical protein
MNDDKNLIFFWMKESWDAVLDNIHRILPAVLAFEIMAVMPALLIWKHFDNRWYAMPWELLIGAPLTVGMNIFFVNLVRKNRADYGDIFRGFSVWPQAVLVSLAYGLIVTAGLIMLVIPGAIWGLTYIFAQYSVIDKKTGIRGSFIHSAAVTYGFKERLLPVAVLWIMLEIFTPGIVRPEGTMLQMHLTFDLKPWVLTAQILKTIVFLPWLDMVIAKAYVSLLKHHDRTTQEKTGSTQ